MYLRDQITSSTIRNSQGTSTLVNIPQGKVYTILDYNLTLGADVSGSIASNQRTYSRITCQNEQGATTTILFLNNTYVAGGTSFPSVSAVGASPFRCYNLVDLILYNSGANNSALFGSISYVPYSISSTTMATSTLFTSQKSYEGNIEYSYSPFQAFLGITGMIFVSLCILVGLFKIFSKFRI